MPKANQLSTDEQEVFSLNRQGGIQAGIKLAAVECKSPVFFPNLFPQKTFVNNKSEITLHAVGFTPVVEIVYENNKPSWFETTWGIIKLTNPLLWWL